MEFKLKEKYLHTHYKENMINQWINFRQISYSVIEYYNQFNDFMLKFEIMEDPLITLHRFINELRTNIKNELEMHKPRTIDDSY